MKRLFRIAFFMILSMPKSVYFNIRTLPLKQAIHLPIIIGYNVSLGSLCRGVLQLGFRARFASVLFGYGGSMGVLSNGGGGYISLNGGTWLIGGKTNLASGASVRIDNGLMRTGRNFSANKNFFLSCSHEIEIGDNFVAGWSCAVRDSDGHTVMKDGKRKKSYSKVGIGNHVWLCSEAHVLKGSMIRNDTVVAYRSLVSSQFEESNLLIAGSPARMIQENINWEY